MDREYYHTGFTWLFAACIRSWLFHMDLFSKDEETRIKSQGQWRIDDIKETSPPKENGHNTWKGELNGEGSRLLTLLQRIAD